MIYVKNLNKNYGNKIVLNNINLSFERGKIYGIMGENGAGKSTLFRCLTLQESYKGEIIIPDEETIGYLPDTPYFYPFIKGKEYIEFCIKARGQNVLEEEIEKANSLLQLPLNDYALNYSLGMKKRLIILTLMLQKSDIYILDEPFNGLDLLGSLTLKKWLQELPGQNKTVIVSSHIISSLTDICDTISYLHAGEIVETFYEMDPKLIEEKIWQFCGCNTIGDI
jgi:ABC-2 type transport system ATP-binding protein